ncbi:MAG: hypothetical protein WAV50_02810 [Minisyncoccia bacterium]
MSKGKDGDDIVALVVGAIILGVAMKVVYKKNEEEADAERKRLERIANEDARERQIRLREEQLRLAEEAADEGRDVCMNCLTVEPTRCYCGNCCHCCGGTSSGCSSCD